ncbi:vacuolar ATPase assembly integral membrane protein VMA21 homolog [Cephus cinctus]|uniref:Vacuolar ATPase assembly integral membrane protein VMA21 homolog n=1 Tax=Cephus cinctus TaxID=211228 RepID=A0AAJ7CED0_CEPCN|nr:vacuolar ATPase assembly integral membrane protein VMA21 homolog [Cephus cinctus]XP_015608786.1 vacuolar ATPase assembly integral membrane protein VMA21 homolog [Cephus cinctus]
MAELKELPELQVFKTVLCHSIVIIAFPAISFFLSKVFVFDGLLGINSVPSNIYAAAVAVVVLHIALGAFIYRAYFTSPSKPQAKTD